LEPFQHPTYSLPLEIILICFSTFETWLGFILHLPQRTSSLKIESSSWQFLQILFLPILFCLLEIIYLAAIFSFVAAAFAILSFYLSVYDHSFFLNKNESQESIENWEELQ
jgi:hypothetical protein